MHLGDDPGDRRVPLNPEIVAERCADLCGVSEETFQSHCKLQRDAAEPVYVIGTDVPAPGGSKGEEELRITAISELEETIELTKKHFYRKNLHSAWERVIGVVVQPGFEYGDRVIIEYEREKAYGLIKAIKKYPGLVFEGHSTDYQSSESLKSMVEDGIAILKVGPYLTFTVRETIFMLSYMENELFKNRKTITLSNFIETLDEVMTEDPKHWAGYYRGEEADIQFSKKYSFLDRSRYYMPDRRVSESLSRLIENLRKIEIPLPLISQFLPQQYPKLRRWLLALDPEAIIRDRVRDVLKIYSYAVGDRENP
jgi:D-tagatose-1,6-bisphosphate aldolase subunit GatZ/KbaZ